MKKIYDLGSKEIQAVVLEKVFNGNRWTKCDMDRVYFSDYGKLFFDLTKNAFGKCFDVLSSSDDFIKEVENFDFEETLKEMDSKVCNGLYIPWATTEFMNLLKTFNGKGAKSVEFSKVLRETVTLTYNVENFGCIAEDIPDDDPEAMFPKIDVYEADGEFKFVIRHYEVYLPDQKEDEDDDSYYDRVDAMNKDLKEKMKKFIDDTLNEHLTNSETETESESTDTDTDTDIDTATATETDTYYRFSKSF